MRLEDAGFRSLFDVASQKGVLCSKSRNDAMFVGLSLRPTTNAGAKSLGQQNANFQPGIKLLGSEYKKYPVKNIFGLRSLDFLTPFIPNADDTFLYSFIVHISTAGHCP